MHYIYDGEFDGFLTCIYKHYYSDKAAGIYSEKTYRPNLLDKSYKVITNQQQAEKVHKAMVKQFSWKMYADIHRTFLSNYYEKDSYLLEYLKIAFKEGEKTDHMRSLEAVYQVQKIGRQVGFEQHRFFGLLRFSQLGNCLYAKFKPDHDILSLLGPHFSDRLGKEKFIIHDIKRERAVVGQNGDWFLTDMVERPEQMLSKNEECIQDLWQTYFEHIGIEGRKNKQLQQSFVPLKYREYITEFIRTKK